MTASCALGADAGRSAGRTTAELLVKRVRSALATVDDPEFPGVSIVDLGMVLDVVADHRSIVVSLVPTYAGCPALAYIGTDAAAVVGLVSGGRNVEVRWRTDVPWSTERISARAREVLARDFAVADGETASVGGAVAVDGAVAIDGAVVGDGEVEGGVAAPGGPDERSTPAGGEIRCPVCGAEETELRAAIGPTRCRSVHWCRACRNVVEVLR